MRHLIIEVKYHKISQVRSIEVTHYTYSPRGSPACLPACLCPPLYLKLAARDVAPARVARPSTLEDQHVLLGHEAPQRIVGARTGDIAAGEFLPRQKEKHIRADLELDPTLRAVAPREEAQSLRISHRRVRVIQGGSLDLIDDVAIPD